MQLQLHGVRGAVQTARRAEGPRYSPHGREGPRVPVRQIVPTPFSAHCARQNAHVRVVRERVADGPLCSRFKGTALTSPESPLYSDSDDPKGRRKTCEYCRVELSIDNFSDHLITSHSEVMFHCTECNAYFERKEFELHASVHDSQYAGVDHKEPNRKTKKTRKRKNSKDNNENAVSAVKSKASQNREAVERTARNLYADSTTVSEERPENEFSDHSDVEYFGRLPESVFRAIEDTQDSQWCNDPRSPNVPETETVDHESTDAIPDRSESKPKPPIKKHKRPRTCPICSKVYTASSSYFYHLNSHRQSDHVCDVCGKRLGNRGSLVQHAAIHASERPFGCLECGKKFRSRASLYIHSESHGDTKSFACDQCDSAFRWRTHLVRHLKRHSAEKTHVCLTCGRGFSVRCDLLRHARTHRAGSHACERCDAKFAQRRYLKVHMMKKHSVVISGSEAPATT